MKTEARYLIFLSSSFNVNQKLLVIYSSRSMSKTISGQSIRRSVSVPMTLTKPRVTLDVEPPEELTKRPLRVPQRVLTGPGPSNCSERVLRALYHQSLGHMHPEMFQVRFLSRDPLLRQKQFQLDPASFYPIECLNNTTSTVGIFFKYLTKFFQNSVSSSYDDSFTSARIINSK